MGRKTVLIFQAINKRNHEQEVLVNAKKRKIQDKKTESLLIAPKEKRSKEQLY